MMLIQILAIDELPFMKSLRTDIHLQLEAVKGMLERGLGLTKLPGGPAPRAENFLDDLVIVETMITASHDSWNTLYQAMQSWSFSRAKVCKGDDFDKKLIDDAQKLTGRGEEKTSGYASGTFYA